MSPLTRLVVSGLVGSVTRKGDQGPTPADTERNGWKTIPDMMKGMRDPKVGPPDYTGDFPEGFGHRFSDTA